MTASEITIRPARLADAAAINDIYNFYVRTSPATFDTQGMTLGWRESWLSSHLSGDLPVLVAIAPSGEVAGWCSLSTWSPKGAYEKTVDESIYIANSWRGQGVGRQLISAILGEARSRGIEVVMAGDTHYFEFYRETYQAGAQTRTMNHFVNGGGGAYMSIGTPLDWVPDRFLSSDGRFIICATHGAEFTITDGTCISGPCKGDRLTPVEAVILDGIVHVSPGA